MSKSLPPLAAALFGNRIVKKTSDSQHESLPTAPPGNTTTLTITPAIVGVSVAPAAPPTITTTTSPTKRSRIEIQQTAEERKKLPLLVTRLFGANRANFCLPVGSSSNIKNNIQTENCNSACSQGCSRRPDSNSFLIEDDDSEEDFDIVDNATGGSDEDTTDGHSSVEDADDAFQNLEFQDLNLSSRMGSSSIKNETVSKVAPSSINEKKTTRQKGDAESLKKYAYG